MTIRLCILQAGENNPKMKASVPGYEALFRAMFERADTSLEFFKVFEDKFPQNLEEWDAFLITGSAAGVYDAHSWIPKLMDLIKAIYALDKPLIGLCFGHQIIAEALGGKAIKSDKGWGLGSRYMPTSSEGIAPLKEVNHGKGFSLLYVHQDQVTELPQGAELLAGDEFCPIGAYSIGDKVLSFQGHPEFTGEVLEAIMDFREENMGSETVKKAQTSLAEPQDSASITDTIVAFIRAHQASRSPSSSAA